MRKNIIIIAAPFGYGPAAKALLIANALAESARVTLFSDGDALRMLERFRAPSIECRSGTFSGAYPTANDLAAFHAFVSVNNDPAVHHLIAHGCAQRTLFVDSLLPWRNAVGTPRFASPIRAYLVQDFPGAAANLAHCHAATVALTAPLIWASPAPPGERGQAGLLLHLGGITSPYAEWAVMKPAVGPMLAAVAQEAQRHGRPLTVIGSAHLEDFRADYAGRARLLPETSPWEAAALVQAAEVVVTTPGIGVLYEALMAGVPVVLLPPMNSTQLHSFNTLTQRGFADAVSKAMRRTLHQGKPVMGGNTGGWLARNMAGAVGGLPAQLDRLLGTGRDAARGEQLRAQAALVSALSTTDPLASVRELALA